MRLARAGSRVFVCVLLEALACGEKPAYTDLRGSFSSQAPPSWRVLENQGGAQRVSFIGPSSGPGAFSTSLGVYFEPGGNDLAALRAYARRQALGGGESSPLIPRPWKGGRAYQFSLSREERLAHGPALERRREAFVLIPVRSGFYVLVHSAPAGTFARAQPEFGALADSFHTVN